MAWPILPLTDREISDVLKLLRKPNPFLTVIRNAPWHVKLTDRFAPRFEHTWSHGDWAHGYYVSHPLGFLSTLAHKFWKPKDRYPNFIKQSRVTGHSIEVKLLGSNYPEV